MVTNLSITWKYIRLFTCVTALISYTLFYVSNVRRTICGTRKYARIASVNMRVMSEFHRTASVENLRSTN